MRLSTKGRYAVMAMAHWQRGQKDEARAALVLTAPNARAAVSDSAVFIILIPEFNPMTQWCNSRRNRPCGATLQREN